MARYTEAILDLAFRQGFERKRQRETEARRQQRQERIGQLLGQVEEQPRLQGPSISGAPLGARPATAAIAELATYGVMQPSHKMEPLIDVSGVPVPDEVKTAYYNRLLSLQQLYQFRDKREKMDRKEMELLWKHAPEVQAAFPGSPEDGVSGVDMMEAKQSFVGAFGKEIGASIFGRDKLSALSEKLRYVRQFLTDPTTGQARRWRGDLEKDPITLGQLDVVNVTYGDLSQIYGWDPAAYGKIEASVLEKLKAMDKINFGINFRRNLNRFMEAHERGTTAEYVEDDDAKNLSINQVFVDWFNPETGELKVDKVIAEKDRLDDIAAQALGYESATDITEDIRELVLQLGADGYKTVQDIDNLIQYYESVGQYPPQHSREILEKVKQSIAAN